jgi:hypothetical protein
VLEQLPAFVTQREKFVVYPGGHLFYSLGGSRQALRSEVERLIRE